jgi:hypothetical protein
MNRCLMNSRLWVFVRVLILFAPVVCFIPDAAAQATAGSIVGRVTDPSKAVVVGAQITALNQATGVSYTSKSNEAGDYIIQRVPPGIYSVTVTQPGFQTEVAKDLELVIDQKLAIDFESKSELPQPVINGERRNTLSSPTSRPAIAITNLKDTGDGNAMIPLFDPAVSYANYGGYAQQYSPPYIIPASEASPASNGWGDGQPAVLSHKYGKGRITYIGAILDDKTIEAAAKWMVEKKRITPVFGPVPDGV